MLIAVTMSVVFVVSAARELDMRSRHKPRHDTPLAKKHRLHFTESQKRTLYAIFKETKKPSREMQLALAEELGLEKSTVSNFFMNARRRHPDLWRCAEIIGHVDREVSLTYCCCCLPSPLSPLPSLLQENELSSVIIQTVPLECTHRELSFELSHL